MKVGITGGCNDEEKLCKNVDKNDSIITHYFRYNQYRCYFSTISEEGKINGLEAG